MSYNSLKYHLSPQWGSLNFKFQIILFLLILLFAGCAQQPVEVYDARVMLGTVIEIKIVDADTRKARRALSAAFHEISRIEKLMSHFNPDSALSQLNKRDYSADRELNDLILKAVALSKITGGGFDVTVGPLMNLWDFKAKKPAVPSLRQIKQALENVGYKKIVFDSNKNRIMIKKGIDIDLGGIAKGYATDRAITILQQEGIHTALINSGGDIRAIGSKEWHIGLQDPRSNGVLAAITVKNRAVVTSGDYERFFFKNGKRYHHILDPHTGYPADQCQSVTVIAPAATEAVALAKGIFIAGPVAGLAMTALQPGTDCIIIDTQGQQHISGGLVKKGNTYLLKED